MSKSYDFIIVGSGPAGSALAWQLASTPKKPSILLVEAGPNHDDIRLRIEANKLLAQFNPATGWGYQSTPNPYLDNRVIGLSRGKGLGGCSLINYTLWTEGLAEDMENMAKITGDDAWKWVNVKERYKKLTTQHVEPRDLQGREKYISPKPGNYGTSGPLHLGYSQVIDKESLDIVDRWDQAGYKLRSDVNDGTLLGLGVYPLTTYRGTRIIASDLLADAPPNLEIITEAPVHRVLFEGTRAVGIATIDGRTFTATKEVILSAGSMDSPKLLMHSGIGPADQLSKYNIPVLHENPNVGQNFQDHIIAAIRFQLPDHTSSLPAYFNDPAAQKAALREWELFRTGPLATISGTMAFIFAKNEAVLKSEEFAALPEATRARISHPDMPTFEVGFGLPDSGYYTNPGKDATFAAHFLLQNCQSRGAFTLQSSDPSVPLLFDTNYLSHPYDRRLAIEAAREVKRVLHSPPFSNDIVAYLDEPKSDSDEDILAWVRTLAGTTLHMSATCTLGKDQVKDKAVVDEKFKVFGVQALRVVDNSIWPVLPTSHIQAHAYQLGMIASEKLIEEYGLA